MPQEGLVKLDGIIKAFWRYFLCLYDWQCCGTPCSVSLVAGFIVCVALVKLLEE